MKNLTLDLYKRIINTFHEQTRNNLKLLGHVTYDECAEYIGFYAFHGGLFWCERDGEVTGVGTCHTGKKHFDWVWEPESGVWTTHCIWAKKPNDLANLIRKFINAYSVKQFYACRRGSLDHLDAKKLERILSYGRRRKIIASAAASSTTVQRVDEIDSESSGGNGSRGIQSRGDISAKVSGSTIPDSDAICEGSDGAIQGASASVLAT
jgi:hypothetical protein